MPPVPTVPMEPTPLMPGTFGYWPPNYFIPLGLLESLPDTFGLFPLSLIIPPLIPIIAF